MLMLKKKGGGLSGIRNIRAKFWDCYLKENRNIRSRFFIKMVAATKLLFIVY